MSLINDALKRAKDAQHKSPLVAAGPQLRPAEHIPAPAASRNLGMIASAIVILILLAALFLLWPSRRQPATAAPSATKNPAPANVVVETKPVVPAVAVATPTATAHPAGAPPAVAIPPSTPAPLKLQAIFFAPGRSSAIVSGKTVKPGDSVREFRVAVINPTSVTLVSTTETNVMKLEEQ
ncbi:MAG TPA: hypothetical protein VG938_10900 [Verrucomicrobiae bacterium]|jgi:hypothetical protein|nr:hypothetical protein [Verrucomicrobiae bacterium]